jgi:hypothetical protein
VKLYKRDYTRLTAAELAKWKAMREEEIVGKIGDSVIRQRKFHDYPKAARHFDSLFPNNYLDPVELYDQERLLRQIDQFQDILNLEKVNERAILNFINSQEAYFIIASVLKEYFHFGHHDAFLFPKFQLGISYKVDYLLVGRSSGGWNFVFVELEAPLGQITMKEGELGSVFRKGIEQVKCWDVWLQAHYSSLKESFDKYRRSSKSLPNEFLALDKSRMNFIIVAGRRSDFREKTYREQRNIKNSSLFILHYDNLIDASKNIIGQITY